MEVASGGVGWDEGVVVSAAVAMDRSIKSRCWRDWRRSDFQQLRGRRVVWTIMAVDVPGGDDGGGGVRVVMTGGSSLLVGENRRAVSLGTYLPGADEVEIL